MRKLIIVLCVLFSLPAGAQIPTMQWAVNVLEFSSEKSRDEYSARQVVGAPDAFPAGKQNKNAWEPKGNKEEYIKVGFSDPIVPKQLVIVESLHPGYISNVLVYDDLGTEYEIAVFPPGKIKAAGRNLVLNTSSLNFPVWAVKIVLKTESDFPVGIDAIGITGSDKSYKLKGQFSEFSLIKPDIKKIEPTID